VDLSSQQSEDILSKASVRPDIIAGVRALGEAKKQPSSSEGNFTLHLHYN
jgi:hypothetical protein